MLRSCQAMAGYPRPASPSLPCICPADGACFWLGIITLSTIHTHQLVAGAGTAPALHFGYEPKKNTNASHPRHIVLQLTLLPEGIGTVDGGRTRNELTLSALKGQ